MNDNNEQGGKFQIELPAEIAQGEYANLAIITHSSSDFVVDFARLLPGVPKAQVKSRVILAPARKTPSARTSGEHSKI